MNTILTLMDVSCYVVLVIWLSLAIAYYHDGTSGNLANRVKDTISSTSAPANLAVACSAAWFVYRIFFWNGQ